MTMKEAGVLLDKLGEFQIYEQAEKVSASGGDGKKFLNTHLRKNKEVDIKELGFKSEAELEEVRAKLARKFGG